MIWGYPNSKKSPFRNQVLPNEQIQFGSAGPWVKSPWYPSCSNPMTKVIFRCWVHYYLSLGDFWMVLIGWNGKPMETATLMGCAVCHAPPKTLNPSASWTQGDFRAIKPRAAQHEMSTSNSHGITPSLPWAKLPSVDGTPCDLLKLWIIGKINNCEQNNPKRCLGNLPQLHSIYTKANCVYYLHWIRIHLQTNTFKQLAAIYATPLQKSNTLNLVDFLCVWKYIYIYM